MPTISPFSISKIRDIVQFLLIRKKCMPKHVFSEHKGISTKYAWSKEKKMLKCSLRVKRLGTPALKGGTNVWYISHDLFLSVTAAQCKQYFAAK